MAQFRAFCLKCKRWVGHPDYVKSDVRRMCQEHKSKTGHPCVIKVYRRWKMKLQ